MGRANGDAASESHCTKPRAVYAQDSCLIVCLVLAGKEGVLHLTACDLADYPGRATRRPGARGAVLRTRQKATLVRSKEQIDDAEELARTPIPRACVWTLFRSGFESRVARHVHA